MYALLAFLSSALSVKTHGDVSAAETDEPEETGTVKEVGLLDTNADWAFFLIDQEHMLDENYTPRLAPVYRDMQLDIRAAKYAVEMLDAAKKDCVYLVVTSAYRSPEKQRKNIEEYISKLLHEGRTEEEAIAYTYTQIAPPGASEHGAGLAMDITTERWFETHTELTEEFDETEEFAWLEQNAYKYGFIMRYHKNKEAVQGGIAYEPWHYRFIGNKAKDVWESGLTLEEYMIYYSKN